MRAADMDVRKMTCPDCGQAQCFQCREEWHGYCTSCEDAFNSRVGNELGSPVLWCQVCKTKIFRDTGCNHMHCSQCGYGFCYICNGALGVCICDAVPIRAKWLRYCLYTVVFTVLFSAIPMVLVLWFPIALLAFFTNLLGCGDSFFETGFCGVPFLICALNCGICCMPLGITWALCTAPLLVCYAGLKAFKNYAYNLTEAKRGA